MAVRFMDSFSHYSIGQIYSKWTTAVDGVGTQSIQVGSGRCLQNCLQLRQTQIGACQGPVWHVPSTVGTLTEGTFGVGMQVGFPNEGNPNLIFSCFVQGTQESNRIYSLGMLSNGTLIVLRGALIGGFASLGQSIRAIQDDSWHFFEWSFTCSGTTASGAVYVDGDHTNPWITYSGQNSGSAYYTDVQCGMAWGGAGFFSQLRFDSFYYGDSQADLKGDSRVYMRLPNSDGALTQWSPKVGTSHFQMVDDNPPDGGTTYNSSRTIGATDTYGFPAIGIPSGTVYAVQVLPMLNKDDVGFRSAAPVIRQGGIVYTGTPQPLADGTYLYYPQVYEKDPTGANWSVTTVNDEFGVEVTG